MAVLRCGLVGAGIGASLSPALHEVEARHHGLDLSYTLFDVDRLGQVLDEAERDGFAGLNVTHPFKQQVIEQLDHLSPQARAIGAVNTVVFRDGERHGHNTDAYGFTEAFRATLPDAATGHVVQLGAGGAGAACAHSLLGLGVERLTIVDPDADRRAELAGRLGAAHVATATPGLLASADGLVNASPIGMHHHPGLPLPAELLHRRLWVVDIVYMPLVTELLRAARAAGARAVGGTAMCAYQAAAAFQLFTGLTPDTARMLDHLDVILAGLSV
ncbi:shikimate dehydrogenase [Actinoplanes aureus]|uniref:Shikimate dehydrogenase (NADP(+)) n=1 Tax=Actinoplanes aureus TaxID=2792083 RepID=A0A931C2Y9_9ACTN|nr:shikimate dehydrogenase [Actinoplanes aureus]MBG0560402.1 shikimate dehydrogenase [Actinoplanes aureus]